jgi:hypothetical protein
MDWEIDDAQFMRIQKTKILWIGHLTFRRT